MNQKREERQRLTEVDPKGRVDVALLNAGKHLFKHVGAEHVWNGGLGEVVEELLGNAGLSKPITALDAARELGILPRVKRALR